MGTEDDRDSPVDSFLRAAASAPSEAIEETAGTIIGRYRVLERVGQGGMGIVYRAKDEKLHRTVALKVLDTAVVDDPDRRRRFLREARVAASLAHPNIAAVYDVGEDAGRVFIAMELIAGGTLRERMAKGAVPIDEIGRIGQAIAAALAKAHAAGVVHRDIKPENVMIETDGTPKVLDFGLARTVTPSTDAVDDSASTETAFSTQHGAILGTVAYMSPEQAKGHRVDVASDVFSFGVVLYELLGGTRPFDGATTVETLIAIARDEPPPIDAKRKDAPKPLVAIVSRCLAKDAASRPTAAELADALADVAGPAARAIASRPSMSSARPPRRSRLLVPLAIAGAAAIVGIASSRIAQRPAPPSESPIPTASSDPLQIPGWAPLPSSTKREALAAYTEGLRAVRRGDENAPEQFERAIELDPDLVAARVWLAMQYAIFIGDLGRARTHLAATDARTAGLGPIEGALLAALEPSIRREPPDTRESAKRIEAALLRFPKSPEMHFWHAVLLAPTSAPDAMTRAAASLRRATALDEGFASAWGMRSRLEVYQGELEPALSSAERCLREASGSLICTLTKVWIQNARGECARSATDAKQLVARTPDSPGGHMLLAGALASLGESPDAVREALSQAHRRTKGADVWENFGIATDAGASLLEGDFDRALREAREREEALAAAPEAGRHVAHARIIVGALLEQGKVDEAGEAARSYLSRSKSWAQPPLVDDFGMATDLTPILLRALARAGKITATELGTKRREWMESWVARGPHPLMRRYLWFHGYAGTADTAESAEEALLALPEFEPLPVFRPLTLVEAHVGRTYVLAGRPRDAMSWLLAATRSCSALDFAIEQTQSFYWLGRAREDLGNRDEACAAYRTVIDRWGKAKPRSVTAEAAKQRATALGCPR